MGKNLSLKKTGLSNRIRRSTLFASPRTAVLTLVVLFLFGATLLLLARSWRQEVNAPLGCQVGFQPLTDHNGYVEIQLKSQQAVEPTFEGTIFVYLTKGEYTGESLTELQFSQSGTESYGSTVGTIPLIHESEADLRSAKLTDFSLVSRGWPHRYFPFDNAQFNFILGFTPRINPHVIRVVNRVQGFVSECDSLRADRSDAGALTLSFRLKRSPLVTLAAVVLCLAATAFLVLIPALESNERVATAVASYFFALWSIRNIMSSQIRVFPTLLDCYILNLCIGMVCLLVWRVLRQWARKSAESRIYLPK